METLTQNLDNIKVRKVNNNIENFDIDVGNCRLQSAGISESCEEISRATALPIPLRFSPPGILI